MRFLYEQHKTIAPPNNKLWLIQERYKSSSNSHPNPYFPELLYNYLPTARFHKMKLK